MLLGGLSMRRHSGLMFPVIMTVVLLAACGGSSGPTVENLKARAEAHGAAMVDGKYSDVYEFAPPECKVRILQRFVSGECGTTNLCLWLLLWGLMKTPSRKRSYVQGCP